PLLQPEAEEKVKRVMEALKYEGLLAIEFFEQNGRLLANEMACRVHNSGHWTIEGAETNQFENHIRAGLNYPLGLTQPLGYAAMVNLIGRVPKIKDMLSVPGAHLHLYNKAPKPGRKLGHVTIVSGTPEQREARLAELLEVINDA